MYCFGAVLNFYKFIFLFPFGFLLMFFYNFLAVNNQPF